MTADYFLYTVGIVVPKTVTRIRIHHSVKHIPDFAFFDCTNLVEVTFMRDFIQLVIVHSRIVFRCATAISHRLSEPLVVLHSMPVLRW